MNKRIIAEEPLVYNALASWSHLFDFIAAMPWTRIWFFAVAGSSRIEHLDKGPRRLFADRYSPIGPWPELIAA